MGSVVLEGDRESCMDFSETICKIVSMCLYIFLRREVFLRFSKGSTLKKVKNDGLRGKWKCNCVMNHATSTAIY